MRALRHEMKPGTFLHAKYAGESGWPGPGAGAGPYRWDIQDVRPLPPGTTLPSLSPALRRYGDALSLYEVEGEGWKTLVADVLAAPDCRDEHVAQ